jgi:hypothetical protein
MGHAIAIANIMKWKIYKNKNKAHQKLRDPQKPHFG